MHLIRLVYASTARPGLGLKAVTSLLQAAEAHNRAEGVVGMLCYGNGSFLQVLEGPRAAVNQLYNRITGDARHTACEILEYVAIGRLTFADWSMRLIGLDDALTSDRRALVARHSGRPSFDPREMTGAQAYVLLRALAQLERDTALSLRPRLVMAAG